MRLKNLHSNSAVLVAIGLALSFALMGVWVRMMGNSFGDFQQTYLRILLAGIMAFFLFRKKFSKNLLSSISKREWTIYIIRATISYAFGVAFFTIAAKNTHLGTVSFIAALPILGILSWIFFREKVPKRSLFPIALSVIGLGLVTGITSQNFSFGLGEWAALICMFGFDIGYIMSRMHNKARSNFENTTILLLLGWIPGFIISLVQHEPLLPRSLSLTAAIGLLMASFANIIGLYAINYVFTNLKAYVAGNLLLLETVFSLALGFVFYGEPITAVVVLGGALIVASAIAVNTINKADEEALSPLLDEDMV